MFPHPVVTTDSYLVQYHHLKSYIEDLCDLDHCLDSLMLFAWGGHPQRSKIKPYLEREAILLTDWI